MTLINYTDFVPTPAPVTSGTTIQTFQDPTGEWWVAKSGVNNGLWLKARDVVRCRYYRTAANASIPATATVMIYDTLSNDPYTLYATGTGTFTCPVAGIYRVTCAVYITSSATNQSTTVAFQHAVPPGAYARTGFTGANNATAVSQGQMAVYNDTIACAAGDTLQALCWVYAGPAPQAQLGAGGGNFMTIEYAGTG